MFIQSEIITYVLSGRSLKFTTHIVAKLGDNKSSGMMEDLKGLPDIIFQDH